MPDTIIRPGTAADTEPATAACQTAVAALRGVWPPPEQTDVARERLALPDRFLLVAERDGVVVGMTVGMDGRDDDGRGPVIPGLCHIGMVFVTPKVWGQGIGGQLVDAVMDEARRRGYDCTQLWTQEDNERALRLYASRGFRGSGRTGVSEDGEPIVHFALGLD